MKYKVVIKHVAEISFMRIMCKLMM